jgi:putative PIN family toxin of toxin-antitoxin system
MRRKKPVKITVDTNIPVSMYVYPGGVLTGIMQEAEAGGCEIGISTDILDELCLVLRKKFTWEEAKIARLKAQLTRLYRVVEPRRKIKACIADPTDDKVLEAAVEFGADYILSGDRHLLDMKKYGSIEIIRPAELIKRL